MEERKSTPRSIEDIMAELLSKKSSIEVSFASKLIATVDPNMPIWDQYVLRNLGLEDRWEKCRYEGYDKRINEASRIYCIIESMYKDFLNSKEGRDCLEKFDDVLPKYKRVITPTKKLDFILWSKRQD